MLCSVLGNKPCYDHFMGSGEGKARRVKASVALTTASVAQLVVLVDGTKKWRDSNGMLHRVDGPAIEWANGGEEWFECGELHRVGGPALVRADGTREWYEHDKMHRVDGP